MPSRQKREKERERAHPKHLPIVEIGIPDTSKVPIAETEPKEAAWQQVKPSNPVKIAAPKHTSLVIGSPSNEKQAAPVMQHAHAHTSLLIGSPSKTQAHPSLAETKTGYQDFSKAYALGLKEDRLCVDLSANLFSHLPRNGDSGDSQASDSEADSLSDDDDNPEAESDRFLNVISKRMVKKKDSRARAGGPLIL